MLDGTYDFQRRVEAEQASELIKFREISFALQIFVENCSV